MRLMVTFLLLINFINASDIMSVIIASKADINIPKLNSSELQKYTFLAKNKNLEPFKIAKYELTVKEYIYYLKSSKQNEKMKIILSSDTELNEPITNINFNEAQSTCKFYGGRLPTEFEWVVAASIKLSKSKCYEHLKQNTFHSTAIDDFQHRCMMKSDNEFEADLVGSELVEVEYSVENINGTFGMFANVWEWVNSTKVLFKDEYKVIKGGSYANFHTPELFDSRISNFLKPEIEMPNVGFRCAWDIDIKSNR